MMTISPIRLGIRAIYTMPDITIREQGRFAGASHQSMMRLNKRCKAHSIDHPAAERLTDSELIDKLYPSHAMPRVYKRQPNTEDIDFNGKLLRVHGKGKKERLVPISTRGCQWLAFYIGKIRPMFAFIGSGKSLFLANNGKRYIPGKLSDMASQYVKLAGFDRTGACHLYRHNTATTMLDNGADLRHIQEMLGHASILTTQLYTHVSRKKLTQVYEDTHPSAQGGSGLF